MKGREIRKAFITLNSNFVLLAADYSQIELRIMANFSKDKSMIEAFKNKRPALQCVVVGDKGSLLIFLLSTASTCGIHHVLFAGVFFLGTGKTKILQAFTSTEPGKIRAFKQTTLQKNH